MGSDGVPGPSTYWIDAVAEVAATIEGTYDLQPASDEPSVVDALTGDVPSGLQTDHSLNQALVAGGEHDFVATVYYSAQTKQLVIVALGE